MSGIAFKQLFSAAPVIGNVVISPPSGGLPLPAAMDQHMQPAPHAAQSEHLLGTSRAQPNNPLLARDLDAQSLLTHFRLQDDSFDGEHLRKLLDASQPAQNIQPHEYFKFARRHLNLTDDFLDLAFRELEGELARAGHYDSPHFSPPLADPDKIKGIFSIDSQKHRSHLDDVWRTLNLSEAIHCWHAIAYTMEKLYRIDTPEGRVRLEQFWDSLNLREKAVLLDVFIQSHFFYQPVSPGGAFFLFQLFGKASPWEIGVARHYTRPNEATEYDILIGKPSSVNSVGAASYPVGHTHPLNRWGIHLSSIFPSITDLSNNSRRFVLYTKDLLQDGAVHGILLNPFGGSYYVTARKKRGLWKWRRTTHVHRIMWAVRPGNHPNKRLLASMEIYKKYFNEELKGDEINFTYISWEELLKKIAERFTLR